MRFAVIAIAACLVGCEKSPPLPPDLPLPKPDLMIAPKPLPGLPELSNVSPYKVFEHAATVRGQCVVDQRRLADLQKYVSTLTRK